MTKLTLKNLIKEVIEESKTKHRSSVICENEYDIQRASSENKPSAQPSVEIDKLYNTLKSSKRLSEGGFTVRMTGDRISLESENVLFIISYNGKLYTLISPKHKEKISTDYKGIIQRIKDDIDGE